MKISIVWSSPNIDGLTAAAKERFKTGLLAAGAEIQEFHLNRLKLGHCMACNDGWGICREMGICAIQDDFDLVYQALQDSEGIVFVTAVYWHDMTEAMKAFIDRLRRLETAHHHFLAEKRCILIACAGGTGRGPIECLWQMEEALKHMNMRVYDRIPLIRYNKDYILPMLEEAGKTYAERLETGFDMKY